MNKAIREAELLVWVQIWPSKIGELERRGHLIEALQMTAMLEGFVVELKGLLAERAVRG